MNFQEIADSIKQARDHLHSVGDGRGAEIMDAAYQEWVGGSIRWRHVDAVDSRAREYEPRKVGE